MRKMTIFMIQMKAKAAGLEIMYTSRIKAHVWVEKYVKTNLQLARNGHGGKGSPIQWFAVVQRDSNWNKNELKTMS